MEEVINYNWIRYLCLADDEVAYDLDGFLSRPDKNRGLYSRNDNLKTIKELSNIKAIAILGDAGLGKTTILKSMHEYEKFQTNEDRAIHLPIDLKNLNSEIMISERLFKNQKFLDWKNSDKELFVYIDSLDECLLSIDNLGSFLVDSFDEYIEREIKIRIACRSGSFPESLESFIRKTSNESNSYLVLPLTREDVILSCNEESVDVNKFFKAVELNNAGSFIYKPITFKFILGKFKRDNKIFSTQYETFQECSRHLCAEHNLSRLDRDLYTFSISNRLDVVSHLAFLCIFSGKTQLSCNDSLEEKDDCLYLLGLLGNTKNEIKEILDTSMFRSIGKDKYVWDHQYYLEFLASSYLIKKNVSLEKLIQLTFIEGDDQAIVVPQLRFVAKWIAAKNLDYLDYLISNDIETIIFGDIASYDIIVQEEILKRYFSYIQKDHFAITFGQRRTINWQAFNITIIEKILKTISYNEINIDPLTVIANLINDLQLTSLKETMLKVFQNTENSFIKREYALRSIYKMINDKDQNCLIAILEEIKYLGSSVSQLRGLILFLLWPKNIIFKDLLSYLVNPTENFMGQYKMFLSELRISKISNSDYDSALVFLNKVYDENWSLDLLNILIDSILVNLFDNQNKDEILLGLGKFIYKCLGDHQYEVLEDAKLFFEKYSNDKILRLKVVKLLYEDDKTISSWTVCYRECSFIRRSDFTDIYKTIEEDTDNKRREFFSSLLHIIYDINNVNQTDKVLNSDIKEVFEAFSDIIKPVDINSPIRIENLKRQARIDKSKNKESQTQLEYLLKVIRKKIHTFTGKPSEVLSIVKDLFSSTEYGTTDSSREYEHNFLWDYLVVSEKNFISTELVTSFLKIDFFDTDEDDFSGLDEVQIATIKFLLFLIDKKILNTSELVYEDWVPVVARATLFSQFSDCFRLMSYIKDELGEMSFQRSYSEYLFEKIPLDKLHMYLSQDNIFISDDLKDNALDLIEKNKKYSMPVFELLKKVVTPQNKKKCLLYLTSFLQNIKNEKQDESHLLEALRLTVQLGESADYAIAWSFVEQNTKVGKKLVSSYLIGTMLPGSFLTKLSNKCLVQIVDWLVKEYGREILTANLLSHNSSSLNAPANLKNRIIETLMNRGTSDSVLFLNLIIGKYPESISQLHYSLNQAEMNRRKKSFKTYDVVELIKLIDLDQSLILRSCEDFQKLLLRTLKDIEKDIHGENPIIDAFWNTNKNGYVPKNENQISDLIAYFLEEKLKTTTILSREVQLRPSYHRGTGQRVDIKASAVEKGKENGGEVYNVMIECKGIWHKDLLTALNDQLSNKYLKNVTKYGIYLVYDTLCEKWKKTSAYKKSVNNKVDLENVLESQKLLVNKNGRFVEPFIMNIKYDY